MPPIHEQPESPLFSQLRPEIRNKIYEFYLDDLRQLNPSERLPVRYWEFSKRPEVAFVAMKQTYGGIPPLLRTCKRICNELGPSVFDHFSISALQIGWSVRGGVGVFGHLDLPSMRRLTIVNHYPTSLHDWLPLFEAATTQEGAQRAGALLAWQQEEPPSDKLVPAATKLEEVVLDWHQKPYWDRVKKGSDVSEEDIRELEEWRSEDEKTNLLLLIARFEALKVVKLRGDYPAYWVDFLGEHCVSKPRIIAE